MSERNSPGQVAGLTPEKRALLLEALRRQKTGADTRLRRRAPGGGPVPLSFAQERLWLVDQLMADGIAYNMYQALRLRGGLDEAALERALAEVVRRHESLRTVFRVEGERPVQEVRPAAFALARQDLRGAEGAEAVLQERMAAEVRRPFDLREGPLFRAVLYALDGGEHVLLVCMHHVVSDGWSMGVLFTELSALYDAFACGEPSPLPELEIQYADYAAWQRETLAGDALRRPLEYWRTRLAGAPAVLELPADRPRPPVQSNQGAMESVLLGPDERQALEALARAGGGTLFMVLMAAWQLLLSRYSGQKDLVVGSPVANRTRSEVAGLIGFFVNTLALRGDLSGDPSFRELLARVKQATLEAYEHQELPFEKLVEELRVERDQSRNPVFQVMFALQDGAAVHPRLGSLEATPVLVRHGISKFDMALFAWEEGGGLRLLLEYATDLFERGTAVRMLRHLRRLLACVAADPAVRASRAELLDADERRQVVEEWSGRGRPAPDAPGLNAWLEQARGRHPDAAAVVLDGRELTYAQLHRRANRLAHRLRAAGVGPDVLVGIAVQPSVEMTVAVLATVKAGGAIVAIDRALPDERLSLMMVETGLRVLLADAPLPAGVVPAGVAVLHPGDDAGAAEADDAPPAHGALPDHLLYAIYTSGSTGRPKGIGVTRAAFTNLLAWQRTVLPPEGERTAQFATFGFCVSFQEMFSTWCAGGTLVLVPQELRRSLDAVVELLRAERVNRLYVPFAALRHLSEAEWAYEGERIPLRHVITAGERLQVTDGIRRLFSRLPGAALHNHYGSSETHVVSALTLDGAPGAWPTLPSVGRPVHGAQVYVLDAALQPVPPGVAGELHAAGACIPRGYLADPRLTAEKLVPDPFSRAPGGRLYRTGDLARCRPDGTIEVLGRVDQQVKVRGFRVETGEVEAALRRVPGVRDAAVAVAGSDSGAARLVAYVVAAAEPAPTAAELRDRLKRMLPEYMVPSVFVPMDALPVNANGKLDLAALPAPAARRDDEGAYRAPRTALESVVAGIWAELLGVERVGVDDSFFQLGGHSLLATRLATRMRELFRAEIPSRVVFGAPTLGEYAAAVLEFEPRPGLMERVAAVLRLSADEARTALAGPAR